MDDLIDQRCIAIARYMLDHRATVRRAAEVFGVSKSSVHKDMCMRLPHLNARLGREVAALLKYNKAVRHLRGGEATRQRFSRQKAGVAR